MTAEPTNTSNEPDVAPNAPEGAEQQPVAPAPEDKERPQPLPTKPERRPGGGKLLAAFALLVALAAAGGSAYLWYVIAQKEHLLGRNLGDRLTQVTTQIRDLQTARDAQQEKLGWLSERQQTLASSLQRLSGELGRQRNSWVLEEARELVRLANDRLNLTGDVDVAIAALKAADERLSSLSDPSLLDIRKLLAQDIGKLQTLDRADVPGIALQLGGLADNVDALPLATRAPERTTAGQPAPEQPAPEENRWLRAARRVWHDLLSLVRIERVTETQPPLLPPEQEYFLRENLSLQLNTAQLALLKRDAPTYRDSLARARAWLDRYFDRHSTAVANVADELSRLASAPIAPALPDVSASLKALDARLKADAGK
jgi:uroporphyrin-3 C-methyltransferase